MFNRKARKGRKEHLSACDAQAGAQRKILRVLGALACLGIALRRRLAVSIVCNPLALPVRA